ncbi:MAG: urease accessory protein UreD [Burkholderiales bacterium]|nr:urease accessory protein UreD [Burkholderiales bacterium]
MMTLDSSARSSSRPSSATAPAPTVEQLQLTFAADRTGRTWLQRRHADYPYGVGQAFRLDARRPDMLAVILQSTSGGMYDGERLHARVRVGHRAEAQVSTQGASVVHAGPHAQGVHSLLTLQAEAHGVLEYLADPLILTPDTRLVQRTLVQADPSARVLLAEAFLMHDPQDADGVFALLDTEVRVHSERGELLCRDALRATGAAWRAAEPRFDSTSRAYGSLYALCPGATRLLETVRTALPSENGFYAGCSLMPNDQGMLVRVLAADAIGLQSAMQTAWTAVQQAWFGAAPAPRRH